MKQRMPVSCMFIKHVHSLSLAVLHWIPKLSAVVKNSLASPENCLVILPTSWVPSADITCTHAHTYKHTLKNPQKQASDLSQL